MCRPPIRSALRHRSPSPRASFPLLLLFVATLVAAVPVPVVGRVAEKHLVESFESLGEVVLEGGERGADGGRAEAVRDEGEVGEAALDAGLQDGAGPRVAQGSPVLGQQVCELLTQLSAGGKAQTGVRLGFPQQSNTTFGGSVKYMYFPSDLMNMVNVSFIVALLKSDTVQPPPRLHL